MNNILNKKFIYFFLIYLSILYLISVFQLHFKHTGGNDSTISEWLINFQGGFTKRGIIGEICFLIAKFFKTELRFIIYIFQISILGIYYFLVFNFFKKFKINFLILLSIFSPIFLLYQVAELEVLGRKEIFIFIGYILFLNLASENFKNKEDLLFIIFVLPILSLIWEPVIFFTPFFICILIFKYKILNVRQFFKILKYFFPFLLISIFIAANPISDENHKIMVESLMNNFGETCYMSCGLLLSKSTIKDQFTANFPLYSFEIIIRYTLIVLIGFGPIFFLSKFSQIKKKYFFINNFKNLLIPIVLLISPLILLFAMGSDWGRWVNITYTFSVLFYFYLLKNKLIDLDYKKSKKLFFNLSKPFLVVFFIIFSFGWNPKTSLVGDVASLPGYRVPYNFIKLIITQY